MSNRAIRNIIRISISRILPEAKKKLDEEGRKKIDEIMSEISSPSEIQKLLGADIDDDSCSLEGRDKFHEKAEKLKKQLDDLEKLAIKGKEAVQEIADKIAPLSDKLDPPENELNPVSKIDKITETINPLLDILQKVIIIAPAILAASSGPAANGAVIAATNNNVNLAKTKIDEYVNLFTSIPRLLDKYKKMANSIVMKIISLKDKIDEAIAQIDQLRMFIIFLESKFESDCNDFFANPNPPIAEPPIVPIPLTLEDIIAQFETLYGDLLNDLILQGDQIAIRRVFVLGEDFERIKNKIGDVKYTSVRKINP